MLGKNALRLTMGMAATMAVAELFARLGAPVLSRPLAWYAQQAQVKADDLERNSGTPDWASVVFVGDSTIRDAFDPELFGQVSGCGLTAYNAALTGLRPRAMEHWVRQWVLPRAAPRLVVVGVTTSDLSIAGSDDFYDRYSRAPAVQEGPLAEASRALARYSAVWRYRAILRDPVYWKPAIARLMPGMEANEPWERFRSGYADPGNAPYSVGGFTMADFQASPTEADALGRTLRLLADSGVDTWAVLMPVSPDYVVLHAGGERGYREALERIRRIASTAGVRIIDLSALGGREAFQDPMHLNTDGSRRATLALMDALGDVCSRARGPGPG